MTCFSSTAAARSVKAFEDLKRQAETEGEINAPFISVEDKDPSILWSQSVGSAMVQWLGMLSFQKRWKIVCVRSSVVLLFFRTLLNTCLPRSLCTDMDLEWDQLPYAYPTVKKKCFENVGGCWKRSCKKVGHSCFRNVVSFKRLPGRKVFKKIGRMIKHLVTTFCESWSFSDLSSSAWELKNRYEDTEPRSLSDSTLCHGCKCPMCLPGVAIGDAGQAYEVLRHGFIHSSLDAMYSKACGAKQDVPVVIYKTVQHKAKTGGTVMDPYDDRTMFWLSRVRCCVECLLNLRFFRVGDRFLMQVYGVPIGGPISGAILDVCLTSLEEKFDKKRWPDIAAQCGLKGPRGKFVASGRYADDTILISRWLCATCLGQILKSVYSNEVDFDIDLGAINLGTHAFANYLDFWVCVSDTLLSITPNFPNELSIWLQDISLKKKSRFPVLSGTKEEVMGSLTRDVMGRLARLRQLKLNRFDIVMAVIIDTLELQTLGYSFGMVARAWDATKKYDFVYVHAKEALDRIKASRAFKNKKVIQNLNLNDHFNIFDESKPLWLETDRVRHDQKLSAAVRAQSGPRHFVHSCFSPPVLQDPLSSYSMGGGKNWGKGGGNGYQVHGGSGYWQKGKGNNGYGGHGGYGAQKGYQNNQGWSGNSGGQYGYDGGTGVGGLASHAASLAAEGAALSQLMAFSQFANAGAAQPAQHAGPIAGVQGQAPMVNPLAAFQSFGGLPMVAAASPAPAPQFPMMNMAPQNFQQAGVPQVGVANGPPASAGSLNGGAPPNYYWDPTLNQYVTGMPTPPPIQSSSAGGALHRSVSPEG